MAKLSLSHQIKTVPGALDIDTLQLPGNLLLPAEKIFDLKGVSETIEQAIESDPTSSEVRLAAIQELKVRRSWGMKAIDDEIGKEFSQDPFAALKAVRSYAFLTDCIVHTVLSMASRTLNPSSADAEPMAVAAVGGYGRAEMAPYSDVDLLFLVKKEITPWVKGVIETALYMMWDLNFKVGHSCRSARDCVRLGREDYTIRTSLLEHRHVFGDSSLSIDLRKRLWNELFKGTGTDFVEAKLAEREERNQRQSGNRYALEPNVKEGKGGLRDLQTLFWIVKYLHNVEDPKDLVKLGMFRVEEFEKFLSAEAFLWGVRCQLHLIAGRAQDKLHFDVQAQVAERLGYSSNYGRSAVEHFMQDYFRFATDVGELTRIFLTKLEAQHVKREPMVVGFLRSTGFKFGRERTSPGYKTVHGRLAIEDENEFLLDPLNMLRLFEEALKSGLLIHPDAMRLVSANLHLINKEFREKVDANGIFLDLLLKHGNPERALRRMNETGVLGMFIPEFRDIVALMQPGGYHRYTVDEHTIQCISQLAQIERRELKEDLPVASRILERGVNRRVLYVALLLHDIGKGRKEDHSIAGARLARSLAPRLGLDEVESGLVEWLVENHLLMSDTAQKRDLSDPKTVLKFVRQVESRARLRLLTVLTVCDIRGVGSEVWNNWKAQLLRDLYQLTHMALSDGMSEDAVPRGVEEAKDRFREAMADWDEERRFKETERHSDSYWRALSTETHRTFAKMLDSMNEREIKTDARLDPGRDATRLCIATSDRSGLFSRFAGALALANASVIDAKAFLTADGFGAAIFWLQDANGKPYENARIKRLEKLVALTLEGDPETGKKIEKRLWEQHFSAESKRTRSFTVPTEITFDNDGSDIYTIVEVDTRDRAGLVYDLARTLNAGGMTIAAAVVATYGVQAVDVFYVKDSAGMKLISESKLKALKKKLLTAIHEPEII